MKRGRILLTIFILLIIHVCTLAQETCQVLLPEISEGYQGTCKRGLAHGEGFAWGTDQYYGSFRSGLPHGSGKYTWANGNVYEGQWRQGKKHGSGVLRFEDDGEIKIISGRWQDGEFAGKDRTPAYEIGHVLNVERYNIRRTGEGSMILLTTYEQGRVNANPQNLIFQLDSGSSIMVGQSNGYENVMFPAEVKITYNVADKLQQGLVVRVRFEVKINEPGVWEIRIHN